MRLSFWAISLAVVSPATAQTAQPVQAIDSRGVATIQNAIAALDAQSRPPEPQRLATARIVMAKLFPPGTYRALMSGSMSQMMGGMTRQMMDVPIGQLAGAAGMSRADLDKMGSATIREIMAIMDPAFEQRMAISNKLMFEGVTELVVRFEPDIREGYAEAYARRLTAGQLSDLNRFLETPSGRAYAANAIPAFADPAVVQRMQTLMPEIIKGMPVIVGKVQAATADLPKPKKPEELSDIDRAKLAKLLGVDPAKLKQTQKKEPTS